MGHRHARPGGRITRTPAGQPEPIIRAGGIRLPHLDCLRCCVANPPVAEQDLTRSTKPSRTLRKWPDKDATGSAVLPFADFQAVTAVM